MSFRTTLGAAAVALVATLGTDAAASTVVTIDFAGGSGELVNAANGNNTFTSGPITMTVGGVAFAGGPPWTYSLVDPRLWGTGLGLKHSSGDGHWIDGYGKNDYITFEFSSEVTMVGASFSYADGDDEWQLYSYVGNPGAFTFEDLGHLSGGGGSGSVASATFDPGIVGTGFFLGAFDDHTEFKLRSITFSYHDAAPVPLPAAGLMLLAGVGGLAIYGRRRRKA